ncbi:MAG: T9SS type A sorting domain-containing protein [Bacteroidales bacterium]|nr:T9SS type A sorting domain-containing protein [Bacteroidales bacterium]
MKTIFTLILFIFLFNTANSQTCEWIRGHETNYEMNPDMLRYNVCTAPDGAVWHGGMKSLVEFYNEAMGNLFLAQFDGNGNLLQEYEITGSAILRGMVTDSEGNLYVTGETLNTLHFWDGSQLNYNNNFIEGFLLKVSPSGTIAWAVNLSSFFTNAVPEDLTVYQDHVYLAHSEWSESNITEFDVNGNLVRSIQQMDVPLATGVALDQEGNIYACGSCSDTQGVFGGVPFPTTLSYSMYLVKYNQLGFPQWVKFAEDITCTKSKVTVDKIGRIIWSGPLLTEAIFDTLTLLGPSWGSDFFVTAFNAEGQVQWGFEVPQVLTGNANLGKFKPICVLPDNSISIAGSTRGVVDWGNGVVTSTEEFSNQSLLLNLSSEAQPDWAKTGLADQYSQVVGIDGDDDGNLYIAGICHGTILFDTCSYTGISYFYPFLAKFNTGLSTGVTLFSQEDRFTVYPNPAKNQLKIESDLSGQILISLCTLNGQEVFGKSGNGRLITIDVSSLPSGIYMLKLVSNSSVSVKKIFISQG